METIPSGLEAFPQDAIIVRAKLCTTAHVDPTRPAPSTSKLIEADPMARTSDGERIVYAVWAPTIYVLLTQRVFHLGRSCMCVYLECGS